MLRILRASMIETCTRRHKLYTLNLMYLEASCLEAVKVDEPKNLYFFGFSLMNILKFDKMRLASTVRCPMYNNCLNISKLKGNYSIA